MIIIIEVSTRNCRSRKKRDTYLVKNIFKKLTCSDIFELCFLSFLTVRLHLTEGKVVVG